MTQRCSEFSLSSPTNLLEIQPMVHASTTDPPNVDESTAQSFQLSFSLLAA
eukprot:CAMPEP_0185189950 /NCGR_PEP_ID=MMETSP1140-20130426/6347_1 /TAXON_ID=298111 /ORGANISM="Pavlova sp., Strain CCMP459" /LENGTH=50 /DNA_ID=CAMNT_0027756541 /DNA_START=234 /DNA_END=382 /DNA_ORIENTATION=-